MLMPRANDESRISLQLEWTEKAAIKWLSAGSAREFAHLDYTELAGKPQSVIGRTLNGNQIRQLADEFTAQTAAVLPSRELRSRAERQLARVAISLSDDEKRAIDWLNRCPYELPDRLESLRLKPSRTIAKELSGDEIHQLAHRHRTCKTTHQEFVVLDIPETRNGIHLSDHQLHPGDKVTLHVQNKVTEDLLQSGQIMLATERVASLVAIRSAFCGSRTYLPGEYFQAADSVAGRLKAAQHAVAPEDYEAQRILLLRADATIEYQNRVIRAGSEFEASSEEAGRIVADGLATELQAASTWILIRNPVSELHRYWPSSVWATVQAGNMLLVAIEHSEITVGNAKQHLDDLGIPQKYQIGGRSQSRRSWLGHELDSLNNNLPRLLDDVWHRARHFALLVERLPEDYVPDGTWKTRCCAIGTQAINAICDHTGENPSIDIGPFLRRLHNSKTANIGLPSTDNVKEILNPLRGWARLQVPSVSEESADLGVELHATGQIESSAKRKRSTPEELVQKRKAAELMMNEGKTLDEIALALGYANKSSVSKLLNRN